MEMGFKNFQMEIYTKENIEKENPMEKEHTIGKIKIFMKAILLMAHEMDMVNLKKNWAKFMKANLKTI
jgi:hypothetical protein